MGMRDGIDYVFKSMKSEDLSWKNGFVLICSKCDLRDEKHAGANAGEVLKDSLKSHYKNSGQWGDLRVMTSSCLGLCPEGNVAVCIQKNSGLSKVVACNSPHDDSQLRDEIEKILEI